MRKVLGKGFYERSAPVVARDLLGKYLVRAERGKISARRITETEAYHGLLDKASHASQGKTERNAPMFGPAGRWYVYLVYGMHWMLNVTTGKEGVPSAVLLRGAGEMTGPGVLTRELGVRSAVNGKPNSKATGLWIEDRGEVVPRGAVRRAPRVGVGFSGEWAEKPLRFILEGPRT